MYKCELDKNSVCKMCGTKYPHSKVIANCYGNKKFTTIEKTSLGRKTINFMKAVIKSGLQGFKFCTEEQIKERYNICKGCKAFVINKDKSNNGNCADCGCNISLNPIFLNKLSHMTESCPREKWGPINKKEGDDAETIASKENSQLQQGGCRPCQR